MNTRFAVVGAAVVMIAASGAAAAEQHLVVPTAFANLEGNANSSIPMGSGNAGTAQYIYAESELAAIPSGSRIVGFQVRQDNNFGFVRWPSVAGVASSYRVIMAKAATGPLGISATFASNLINPVEVRSGPLAIAAQSYPGAFPIGGTTPKGWGPQIALQTEYVYRGGPLAIEFRVVGIVGTSTTADAQTNSAAAAGGGNASSDHETTSNGGAALIIRLAYVTGACVGDLNADTFVDDADFVLFAAAYNILDCADPAMPAGCPADLNTDSVVDDLDFVLFAAAYNELLCP
ncbi:MAG: hypothetical protein K2Y21_03225 [Phycisphaerales bacterium]|nr:hypothetical protein [Phycisphaerales bacterium]